MSAPPFAVTVEPVVEVRLRIGDLERQGHAAAVEDLPGPGVDGGPGRAVRGPLQGPVLRIPFRHVVGRGQGIVRDGTRLAQLGLDPARRGEGQPLRTLVAVERARLALARRVLRAGGDRGDPLPDVVLEARVGLRRRVVDVAPVVRAAAGTRRAARRRRAPWPAPRCRSRRPRPRASRPRRPSSGSRRPARSRASGTCRATAAARRTRRCSRRRWSRSRSARSRRAPASRTRPRTSKSRAPKAYMPATAAAAGSPDITRSCRAAAASGPTRRRAGWRS